MKRLGNNQKGFSILAVILALVVLGVVGFAAMQVLNHGKKKNPTEQSQTTQNTTSTVSASNCSAVPQLQTPVNLSKVSSILYPGQVRGGDYKAHGGFRFDGSTNNITVKAPMNGEITRASRYVESGEVQVLLEFSADCNYAYRFDHILKVAPALQSLVDSLPQATADSRTTQINPPFKVKAGDTIATAIGFTKTQNVGVDFGVYDMNHKNKASENPSFAAKYGNIPNNLYGVCWFDLLSPTDAATVRSLPAGDAKNGKTSDFCQP